MEAPPVNNNTNTFAGFRVSKYFPIGQHHNWSMPTFLGLDCGGSSSRVLLVDESDAVIFRGQSGPANLATTGDDQVKKNLELSLRGCPAADYVCGCFAGLLTESDRRRAVL